MKSLGGGSDSRWPFGARSSSDSEPLSSDEVFEILSNHRRRMVLYYLRQNGEFLTVNELAEKIAATENEVPVDELTSQQRKRVYVSLYQTHLPKMAQTNVIDYDEDEGVVRLTDRSNSVDRYLTTSEPAPYPWLVHYVILSVIGATFVALSLLEVSVFSAVPPLFAGIATIGLYVASAAIQYWIYRNREQEIPVELIQYHQ